jgi:hypothetical protein
VFSFEMNEETAEDSDISALSDSDLAFILGEEFDEGSSTNYVIQKCMMMPVFPCE